MFFVAVHYPTIMLIPQTGLIVATPTRYKFFVARMDILTKLRYMVTQKNYNVIYASNSLAVIFLISLTQKLWFLDRENFDYLIKLY